MLPRILPTSSTWRTTISPFTIDTESSVAHNSYLRPRGFNTQNVMRKLQQKSSHWIRFIEIRCQYLPHGMDQKHGGQPFCYPVRDIQTCEPITITPMQVPSFEEIWHDGGEVLDLSRGKLRQSVGRGLSALADDKSCSSGGEFNITLPPRKQLLIFHRWSITSGTCPVSWLRHFEPNFNQRWLHASSSYAIQYPTTSLDIIWSHELTGGSIPMKNITVSSATSVQCVLWCMDYPPHLHLSRGMP